MIMSSSNSSSTSIVYRVSTLTQLDMRRILECAYIHSYTVRFHILDLPLSPSRSLTHSFSLSFYLFLSLSLTLSLSLSLSLLPKDFYHPFRMYRFFVRKQQFSPYLRPRVFLVSVWIFQSRVDGCGNRMNGRKKLGNRMGKGRKRDGGAEIKSSRRFIRAEVSGSRRRSIVSRAFVSLFEQSGSIKSRTRNIGLRFAQQLFTETDVIAICSNLAIARKPN